MGDDQRPAWWDENERLREELGLYAYEPPRFQDGTSVQRVVDELEDEYGCPIRLIGINTDHGDEWEVRLNGTTVTIVRRERTRDGVTVYETTAEQFRERVEARLSNSQ